MRGLLDPKVDFVFKNIFGSPKHPRVLISFLNAALKPVNKITSVEIKGNDFEMSIEEIREAKDELVRISNDKEQREIYEMRSKILKDKVSALNEAERKGIEQGIKQGMKQGMKQGVEKGIKEGKIIVAKNLLDVLDNETISLKTGLSIYEVEELRSK